MKRIVWLASVLCVLQASPAVAQATRTWVSGVGDDVNPCSRTAPCKTFAGAISKTAAGGEISVLDPGGFGGVTITKSISITQDSSGEGGITAPLSTGIIINGAGIVVHLRGLIIEGGGNGVNGIRFVQGASLHVENCVIRGFKAVSPNGHGILFTPSATAELYIHNTVIANNGTGSTGGGVLIAPTGAASVKAVLTDVAINDNNFGLRADGSTGTGGVNVTIHGGSVSGNGNAGILAVTNATASQVMVFGTLVSGNGFGVRSDGAGATLRFGDTSVTGNGTGVITANGGTLLSYGNNRIDGNTANGANPTVIPLK